jgi:hypothetical protein
MEYLSEAVDALISRHCVSDADDEWDLSGLAQELRAEPWDPNNPRRGNRAHVGTLVMRRRLFACCHVDGSQRVGHGSDWLHPGTHADDLSCAHSAFDAAGALAETLKAVALHDFIVRGASGTSRRLKPISDLDTFDCLNSH